MIGDFEAKIVRIYIDKNYPGCEWVFYVIKDDVMTITYRDKSKLCEVTVSFNELINSCNYEYK